MRIIWPVDYCILVILSFIVVISDTIIEYNIPVRGRLYYYIFAITGILIGFATIIRGVRVVQGINMLIHIKSTILVTILTIIYALMLFIGATLQLRYLIYPF